MHNFWINSDIFHFISIFSDLGWGFGEFGMVIAICRRYDVGGIAIVPRREFHGANRSVFGEPAAAGSQTASENTTTLFPGSDSG